MAHVKHTNFIRRWGNERDLAEWYAAIQKAIDSKTVNHDTSTAPDDDLPLDQITGDEL